MRSKRSVSSITLGTFALTLQSAFASEPPQEVPERLLAGPDASAVTQTAPTLLDLDFDGRLEHIVGEAGIEAMRRLGVSDAQRAVIDEITQQRTAEFNEVTTRAFPKLLALEGLDARLQGSLRTRSGAYLDLLRAYLSTRLVLHRETAIDAMERSGAFEPWKLASARSMVAAYEKAIRDELAAATPNLADAELDRRTHIALLLELLKDAIEMKAKTGEEEFAHFSEAVGLTPAQAERVKSIFAPIAVQEYLGNRVGLLDRTRALLEVSRELTAAQRERAWRYIKEQDRAARTSMSD